MIAALGMAAALATGGSPLIRAELAPPVYATGNYALTFRTPPNLTYCPLSDDWVGSDHGTTLFLVPPLRCGGTGYPSSARSFTPLNTPRIEVYYGYLIEDAPPDRPCRMTSRLWFMGKASPLCKGRVGRMITLETWGSYEADEPAEVSLRLVTTQGRLASDTKILIRLATSLHACHVADASPPSGAGAPCPKASWF